jgi:hypothetical protein
MWETKQRLDDLADLIWELDHCDDEDVTDGAPVEGGGSHGDVEADEVHGTPAPAGYAPVRTRPHRPRSYRLPPGVAVEVRVLGPVQVVGWQEAPTRRVVTELLCFLALHPDQYPISNEAILAALWPDIDRTASARTLRNYLTMLRKCLGDQLFPQSVRGAGYELDESVSTDWARFCDLVAEGAELRRRGDESAEWLEPALLRTALGLVRGMPFAGGANDTYAWAFEELLVSDMTRAIGDAAARVIEYADGVGNVAVVAWAARQGLRALPFEEDLWFALLSAEAVAGQSRLEQAWRDCRAVMGETTDRLRWHVQQLREDND